MDIVQVAYPAPVTGWGQLWHGATADAGVSVVPAPCVLVTMDAGEECCAWVHKTPSVVANLYVGIDDAPDAVIASATFLAFLASVLGLLLGGVNVVSKCGAGISRSSYLSVAVLMALFNLSYDDALLLLRKSRPIAQPNTGFEAALRKDEAAIRDLGRRLRLSR